jgi:hypothetical protein
MVRGYASLTSAHSSVICGLQALRLAAEQCDSMSGVACARGIGLKHQWDGVATRLPLHTNTSTPSLRGEMLLKEVRREHTNSLLKDCGSTYVRSRTLTGHP